MSAAFFDTYTEVAKLKESGFSEESAVAIVKAIEAGRPVDLATRSEVELIVQACKKDLETSMFKLEVRLMCLQIIIGLGVIGGIVALLQIFVPSGG